MCRFPVSADNGGIFPVNAPGWRAEKHKRIKATIIWDFLFTLMQNIILPFTFNAFTKISMNHQGFPFQQRFCSKSAQ
jgi:hypothetical protein